MRHDDHQPGDYWGAIFALLIVPIVMALAIVVFAEKDAEPGRGDRVIFSD